MAAIEYETYYWCVILNGKEANVPGESVLLHADEMTMDPTGSLVFKSAGRRPAGVEPKKQDDANGNKASSNDEKNEKQVKEGGKDDGKGKDGNMIYLAFAPGSWRTVYAAKLQDGSPALVEHWNAANGNPGLTSVVPANSGAVGYQPHQ
jgi:hypothetical protein